MSSTLWAVEAAKKNKANDVLPGSSQFITAEMKTNLLIAKDGILSFNDSLLACVVQLNEIIEGINSGMSPELLEKTSKLSLASYDVKEEESTMSRSYSTWSNIERSSTEGPSRPELKLELSEKVPSMTEPILPSNKSDEAAGEVEASKSTLKALEPEKRSTKQSTEQRKSPVSNGLHSKQQNVSKLEREYGKEPPATRPTLPSNSTERLKGDQENAKIDDTISTALSPIHIPRTTAPLTSPNDDLSFIPIANSINPQKFDVVEAPNVKTELLEESDTSFQAISTAIRKSFAGKLSMGQFAGSLPLYSEYRDEPDARPKAQERAIAKNEIPISNSKNVSGSKSSHNRREISVYTKRSSVFVTLPDREPISYLNSSRQSIKIKSEDSDGKVKSKHNLVLPGSSSTHLETDSSKLTANASASRLVNIAKKLDLRIPKKLHQTRPLDQTKTKEPNLAQSNTSSIISRASSFPKISPADIPTRGRSPVRDGERVRSAFDLQKKFSSRTTDSGSPNRGDLNGPSISASSRIGARSRNVFSLKTDDPSSAESSRSPTKYSHRTDIESGKDSPTDYKVMTTTVKTEPEILQSLTLPTTASITKVEKPLSSKEPLFKNRFLTTTLNPENPPHFAATKAQQKKSSPVKRAPLSSHDKARQDRKLTSLSLKFEPSSRPKQKINLSINHAQGQRDINPRGGSSPTGKLVTSPKKRERYTTDKPDFVLRKSIKRAPDPPDIYVAPRKRAMGNAIPLPDAARGIFAGDRNKEKRKKPKSFVTPSKPSSGRSVTDIGVSRSPEFGPDALPEIPSDDEALKNKKYLKSWAETPELLRVMKENKDLDPVAVFGDVPVLKMDDVFESSASRQRGMASPKTSP